MTIIIRHKDGSQPHILMGTGYGMYKYSLGVGNLAEILTPDQSDDRLVVMACDSDGEIVFLDAVDVKVISVDNKSPKEIFYESK